MDTIRTVRQKNKPSFWTGALPLDSCGTPCPSATPPNQTFKWFLKCLFALCFVIYTSFAHGLPTPSEVAALVEENDLQPLTEGALTFIQITDTHIPRGTGIEGVELAVQEAAEIYPEAAFIVFTGDNCERYSGRNLRDFNALLKNSPIPAYAVHGNTDTMRPQYPPGPVEGTYLNVQPERTLDSISTEDFTEPTWRSEDDLLTNLFRTLDLDNLDRPTWYRVDLGENIFLFLLTLDVGHEGALRGDQLDWIHEQLAGAADKNVFLFSHHGEHFLLGHDHFYELLQYHHPRFRQIVHAFGHGHNIMHRREGDIPLLEAGYFPMGGEYRVFHIKEDGIISYMRRSPGVERLKMEGHFQEGGMLRGQLAGEPFQDLRPLPEPVVIPLQRRPDAEPVPKEKGPRGEWASWRGNETPNSGDDVLQIVFDHDHGSGSEHHFIDRSPYGNDVFLNLPGNNLLEKDGRAALRCGYGGARSDGVAFGSYSLSNPVVRGELRVEAVVLIPDLPLGVEYGIVDAGSYRLRLSPDGHVQFEFHIQGEEDRLQLIDRCESDCARQQRIWWSQVERRIERA